VRLLRSARRDDAVLGKSVLNLEVLKIFLEFSQMAEFRENIKRIRIKRKLTQVQMTELLGISSVRHYQHYEAGTKEPNITTLKRIATILKVSTDELIGHEPQKGSKP
jgi:DNA-binding XRE family transcriptional regulator